MTQVIYEVYDALKSIGVSEEKATQVAKALSEHDQKIDALRLDLLTTGNELKAEIKLIMWILGVVVTLQVGILLRLLIA